MSEERASYGEVAQLAARNEYRDSALERRAKVLEALDMLWSTARVGPPDPSHRFVQELYDEACAILRHSAPL